ncbi:MAG: hypothetical protein CME65_14805 [Halobacteriovoraceae bacterium]|nr:hypothetical protein [Halobacteriovoraceae bacterium]|tara:strand:- start:1425 stop:1835 length:411 start_codon:yes stop_codon:yes gene_type:complete
MLIGGLSEKELKTISELLDSEDIKYSIKTDQSILKVNEESLQNNLRHLNSPSISTDILALELDPLAFDSMSENLKQSLLELGITNEVPQDLFVEDREVEHVQHELNTGNKRLIGHYAVHSLIAGLILMAILWYLKN